MARDMLHARTEPPPEGEKILERVRKQNRAAADRAAKWDRQGRTDQEIIEAYNQLMAERRKASA